METVVKTLGKAETKSLCAETFTTYRNMLHQLLPSFCENLKAYRVPVAPVGPHSSPPDHQQPQLGRNTLHCRPTEAPRYAGLLLHGHTVGERSKMHRLQRCRLNGEQLFGPDKTWGFTGSQT